jgi:cytoplasmic iron level regulating protein YaaA (DUF328/UPF0246 family)
MGTSWRTQARILRILGRPHQRWLNEALKEQGDDVLLSLASNEYFSGQGPALDAR